MHKIKFELVKQTFINGLISLIPVVALLWLCSGFVGDIFTTISSINNSTLISNNGGLLLLIPLLILALVVLILLSGLLVRHTIFKRIDEWFEQKIMNLIPGYGILKSMVEEKVSPTKNLVNKAVLVSFENSKQLGVLTDTNEDFAVVFFPNNTLTGGGSIHLFTIDKIEILPISLDNLDDIITKDGKGLLEVISNVKNSSTSK